MRDRTAGGPIAVDEDEIRRRVEGADGAPHRQQRRLEDIHGIDGLFLSHAEPDGEGFGPDGEVKLLAPGRAEPFGIVDPVDDRGGRKDHGGSHHRPCQAPSPDLIDAGNEAIPLGKQTSLRSGAHRRIYS